MEVTERTETIDYLVFEFGNWRIKVTQRLIDRAHHILTTKPFYKLTAGDNSHIYKNRNEFINEWLHKRMKKGKYESDPLMVEVGIGEALIAFRNYIFRGYYEKVED